MKTVLLVAPHFVPSFLPSVHRSRLWSYYLPEFGWKPIILTTHERYYECQVDHELLDLLPPDLEIVRTRALPTKPVRLIGDIAIRSLFFYYRAISRMAREGRLDFVHFTVPAYNAALLGPLLYRRYRLPYGIDYIDPWVHEFRSTDSIWKKPRLAQVWSKLVEPIAVRDARLITGVNSSYFESVLVRNPHLRDRAETAGMPYGGSDLDFRALSQRSRPPFLFDPKDGRIHLIYAGALLPQGFAVLDRLLGAIAQLAKTEPAVANQLRVHFVGTGLFENDSKRGHVVEPFIRAHKLEGMVSELPSRISYLDTLNHLACASGVLVLGSIERHYSPSKLYQSVMSGRPVFALLHEQSTAVPTMRDSNAGSLFTFTAERLPNVSELAGALAAFLRTIAEGAPQVNWTAFSKSSARESARILAGGLDRALRREAGAA